MFDGVNTGTILLYSFLGISVALFCWPWARSKVYLLASTVPNVFRLYILQPPLQLLVNILAPIAHSIDRLFGVGDRADRFEANRITMWIIANLVAVLILVAFPSSLTLALAILLTLLHIALIALAFFAVDEDFDVWDGIVEIKSALFRRAIFVKSRTLGSMHLT